MFHANGPSILELAHQVLSSTEGGYDLLAPKFDFTPFRTPVAVLRALEELVRAELRPRRVLDLCCGTGAVAEALDGESVVGIDTSLGMLRQARKQPRRGPVVRADALKPPFSASFDLVTCFGALGHFLPEECGAFVGAIDGCLVSGGHFVFVTAPEPGLWSRRFWLSHAFDAAMTLRNLLWSPPFTMFYRKLDLTLLASKLRARGFRLGPPRYIPVGLMLVVAEKPSSGP